MIPAIIIGLILWIAAPDHAGGWNIQLIGEIVFWFGVVTTALPLLLVLFGVSVSAILFPWRSRSPR